jgi:hypothetical protein
MIFFFFLISKTKIQKTFVVGSRTTPVVGHPPIEEHGDGRTNPRSPLGGPTR